MLIMYRGCELVPVKDGDRWRAQIFSGGRLLTTTMLLPREEPAIAEAKKIVDEFRGSPTSCLA